MTTTQAQPSTAELLEQHGLTGERLLKLARRIALDAERRAPTGLGGKREDLTSYLTEKALEAMLRYDPATLGPGYTLTSWLCDIMEHRVIDFYRRKSEGYGDRRYGNDARIILAGDTLTDEPDPYTWDEALQELTEDEEYERLTLWANAAHTAKQPLPQWAGITEATIMQWTRAAQHRQLHLDVWVRINLNHAAHSDLQAVA